MKRYEYRIEYYKFITGKKKEEQLLDALNALGSEGWRLNKLYGDFFSLRNFASWKGGINLLLEREIEDTP